MISLTPGKFSRTSGSAGLSCCPVMPMAVRLAPGIGCAFSPIFSMWRTTASICSGRAPASITTSIGFPLGQYNSRSYEENPSPGCGLRSVLRECICDVHRRAEERHELQGKGEVDGRERQGVDRARERSDAPTRPTADRRTSLGHTDELGTPRPTPADSCNVDRYVTAAS